MEVFSESITSIVGWLASFVVLSSFLMKNINTLRAVNAAGAVLFIIYGCLLNFSIPIIFTNFAIVCINIFYLIRSQRKA